MSDSVVSTLNVRKRENAIQLRHCPLCAREVWHYNGNCWNHSTWPKPASLGGRPVLSAEDSPRRVSTYVPPRLGLRVKRFCGHLTEVPYRSLCQACMTYLRGSLCKDCDSFPRPLPKCDCHRTYLVSEDERQLKAVCEYCHSGYEIWEGGQAVQGRWGFRLVPTGVVDASGEPEYKRVSALFTKRLSVCKVCRTLYDYAVRFAEEGETAFLPER